jgi:sulfur carrier protein
MIEIQFNGDKKRLPNGTTIEQLLLDSGVPVKFCAVELNLEIVPKDGYVNRVLQDGDVIEVVTLVGGG